VAAIAGALGPAQANATVDKSESFRILTTVKFDNGRRTTSEVAIRLGGDDDPYRVLSWQDDVMAAVRPPRSAGDADDR
jgi:general secretion pathway protein K